MEAAEPRGTLERKVLAKLEARGWTVIGARRSGVDLDLDVERAGTRGAVRFRNPFAVSGRDAANAESSPTWFRVDLGEPTGEPLRWAVWDRYQFPSGKHSPSYCALILHEAIGEGWASVAGCSVAPQRSWYELDSAVEAVLGRVEALSPGHEPSARRSQIVATARLNYSAQRPVARDIVVMVVLLAVAGAMAAAGAEAIPRATDAPRILALAVVVGLPVLIFTLVAGITLFRLLRRPRKPLEGMRSIAEAIRSAGGFVGVSLGACKLRDGLPVVVRRDRYPDASAAPLAVSRLSGRSTSGGLRLEADLCELAWPEGTLPEERFVPERWLTTDLRGDAAELRALPAGPREERYTDLVRWTFTGSEIDSGAVTEHFRRMATSRESVGGPYR